MSTRTNDLDRALESLGALARADSELASEEARARRAFFGPDTPVARAGDELAERRFREWFLLERVCEDASAVPIEVLAERIDADRAPELSERRAALLNSRAGAFEVSGVQAGVGIWLRDLAGRGEVPVGEAEASRELLVGDLIVGRVFPFDDGTFELSRAAGCFRHPELVPAVERDLERARGPSRGPLRIGQLELERMFFAATGPATGAARTSDDPVGDARAALVELGLSPERGDAVIARLRTAPRDPRAWTFGTSADGLGPILDELAFDTDVDLERVRAILLELWPTVGPAPNGPDAPLAPAAPNGPSRATASPDAGGPADVRSALDEFDDGRRAGRDLDGLFRELEARLGLEPEGLEDPGELPDFPGVVGAMVVEFLWEQHARDPKSAAAWQDLALLGRATQDVGVFENLKTADLVRFAAFWVPETRPTVDPAALIDALRAFARWCVDEHQLGALDDADATLGPLAESLPRLVRANATLAAEASGAGELWELVEPTGELPLLRRRDGHAEERPLPDELLQHLELGDYLRIADDRVLRVYPPELALAEPER